jgi:hypothetical protein
MSVRALWKKKALDTIARGLSEDANASEFRSAVSKASFFLRGSSRNEPERERESERDEESLPV